MVKKLTVPQMWRAVQSLDPTPALYPPWPEDKVLRELLEEKGQQGLDIIAELFSKREKLIRQARENPFEYGFEWECWARADDYLPVRPWDHPGPRSKVLPLLSDTRLIVVFGGNRASKSYWAAKRCVQTAQRWPRSLIILLCQKIETSRKIQQEYVWEFLPQPIKILNGTRDPKRTYYVNYQRGTGFANEKVVFPNGSEILFLVYTQNPDDYEGIQVGSPDQPGAIGWYADESLPMPWLTLLRTRSATRDATGLWTFTPLQGMTPTVADVRPVDGSGILAHEEEPFLAGRPTLPTLPLGHMPTVQRGNQNDTIILYFHTRENPLGGYERVKKNCLGKPWYMAERALCGYARDTRGRMFAQFGGHNIVAPAALPKRGAVYMHVDPHPSRNWFMLWLVVDSVGRVFVFDEWPPETEFGEWAVSTQRRPAEDGGKGWDGDPGPAQESVQWGIAQYKREMLRREAGFLRAEDRKWTLIRRTVDRRAGPAPMTQSTTGSTCLWTELNSPQTDLGSDAQIAPPLPFDLASGEYLEEDGLELIRQALWIDKERPIDSMNNAPRLYITENCKQLIWALQNYTGKDGRDAACKDPIDCLRDMLTSEVPYIEAGSVGSFGGGSY